MPSVLTSASSEFPPFTNFHAFSWINANFMASSKKWSATHVACHRAPFPNSANKVWSPSTRPNAMPRIFRQKPASTPNGTFPTTTQVLGNSPPRWRPCRVVPAATAAVMARNTAALQRRLPSSTVRGCLSISSTGDQIPNRLTILMLHGKQPLSMTLPPTTRPLCQKKTRSRPSTGGHAMKPWMAQ